jgi:hypothetical protein
MASEVITAMPEFSLHFLQKSRKGIFARRIRTRIAFSDPARATALLQSGSNCGGFLMIRSRIDGAVFSPPSFSWLQVSRLGGGTVSIESDLPDRWIGVEAIFEASGGSR